MLPMKSHHAVNCVASIGGRGAGGQAGRQGLMWSCVTANDCHCCKQRCSV